MRTNIDIDDKLMKKAMKATGATTKKATVEESLRLVVQIKEQAKIRKLFGKVVWRGPDDDWFASDEEIREKRRQEEPVAEQARDALPATTPQPAIAGELR
jgi:Arc/MetJ family transcription regulator